MRHCTIYLNDIETKEQLHSRLKGSLMLPSYYGNNLDALKDCITDFREDIEIVVCGLDRFSEKDLSYAEALKSVLLDCADEDEHLKISFK